MRFVARPLLATALTFTLAIVTAVGHSAAALHATQAGRKVTLVSLPDWSLIAWKRGTSICFLWHGEPTAIETASGCRPPLTRPLALIIGETGTLTRLAGLALPAIASVTVTANGRTFSARTSAIPTALGRGLRFFFLQFRPHLPAAALKSARWTVNALDAKQRLRGALHL